MRKLRMNKHRYGFCIELGQHICFDMDINDWRFIPSIEFHRRPKLINIVVLAFLCFELRFYRWRFDK